MKVKKKVLASLEKCYSIAPLHYKGKEHILIAAEKTDRCLLFDADGYLEDTIWSEPGGVMTMVQVPKTDGQFLATHRFYSPNDSKAAQIVIATPSEKGWEIRTLINLPHVHRFDIIERNGVRYLIACTLKSGHEFKEDWSMPGKVYAAVLPEDLSAFDGEHQLAMEVIQDNLLKNHGYCRVEDEGVQTAIISCDSGVYQFIPPQEPSLPWEVSRLLKKAASDAVYLDLDGDDKKELAVISPFHGDKISIWKKVDGEFQEIYVYDHSAEFSHAIFGGMLCGKASVVIGYRKAEKNLLVFTYNFQTASYDVQILDEDCGPANVYKYTKDGQDIIISTNREIDEVAMYILEE